MYSYRRPRKIVYINKYIPIDTGATPTPPTPTPSNKIVLYGIGEQVDDTTWQLSISFSDFQTGTGSSVQIPSGGAIMWFSPPDIDDIRFYISVAAVTTNASQSMPVGTKYHVFQTWNAINPPVIVTLINNDFKPAVQINDFPQSTTETVSTYFWTDVFDIQNIPDDPDD